ncbi:NTP transferase domain-containing protein [Candidatus Peregrinibacteria bacterium]|nr:MAG: NTP transferase domain-containing protein [Candidatus Peregrinibacteria bacterium]
MKGIILAGGTGSRLSPLTKVTSKQLLPVYDRPMIYFPLQTLLKAGIKDILIIVSPEHSGDFMELLGSGKELGAELRYEVQDKPNGLAEAILIGEDFIDGKPCALILGDNIFTDDMSEVIQSFQSGAHVFVKEVHDPERFGVVEMNGDQVVSIEEKPETPKSNYAQTGLYLYDSTVVAKAKSLAPSKRGELEITDLNRKYLDEGSLKATVVKGEWIDAGTFESLFRANQVIRELSR